MPKAVSVGRLLPVGIFVLAFAAIGAIALIGSHAATPAASIEAESGTISSTASSIPDTTASGGHAVKFGVSGGSTGTCTGAANTPGGPDPWGGCFPGLNNTGVPAGTTLTAYTGPMTITTSGTVIDSKTVSGTLQIKAANVMIKNSKVSGRVAIDEDDSAAGYSFTIQDSLIVGGPINDNDYNYNVGQADFTVLRSNIQGGGLGVDCETNCTLQDSYVWGLATDPTGVAHEGAIRVSQGGNTIHNSLQCAVGNEGCSADYTGYGDFAAVENQLIEKNLMMATTGGGCAYGGSSAGKPYSADANHIQFISNVFQRGTAKSDHGLYVCGYYFSSADYDPSAPGNAWTGNIYDDGTPLQPNSNT